jgi:hypothetical protein
LTSPDVSSVKGWTLLHTADNPAEVGFVRGLLGAEGIETRARSMDLWAAAVEIYFAEGARPSVWVRDREVERARRILASLDRQGKGPQWVCDRCGERIDGQFTACWRCAGDDA